MQNKATMMHHLMPVRITISKEPTNNIINAEEAWRSGTSYRARGNVNWGSHGGGRGAQSGSSLKTATSTFKEMNSMKNRQNRLTDILISFAVFSQSSASLK